MHVLKYRIIRFFLLISLIFSISVTQADAANITSENAYDSAAKYMVKTLPDPTFGNEWFILALARGDYQVPSNYYDTYYNNLVHDIKAMKGVLHSRKYTEYSRVILALSAIGKDAQNVGGYNLVEKLYDFDNVVWQGINGPVFALIALDSWGYSIPETASNSREKMIDYILSKQLDDGGFALSGTSSDPDITAMVIQALSTYRDQPRIKQVVDEAIQTLANIQGADGSYESWEVKNSESVAQVLVALTSMGINPDGDERFKKIITQLLNFYNGTDGGFKHVLDKSSDGMATEQASYALASYHRLLSKKTKLYDMSDTKQSSTKRFIDTKNHWARSFIDEASTIGLISGYPDNTFKPNNTITRLQAISIISRIIGLEGTKVGPYNDTTKLDLATQKRIGAAYEAGIITSSQNGQLRPNEKLTRVELAQMLGRAFKYEKGFAYNPEKLAPYNDIQRFNEETKNAITLLYDYKIATGSNGSFNPSQYTTRGQACVIFVNFYKQFNR
ncbi:S-layer homology domain-containing protein [Lysinibacillus sp. SGAir0095]|uniref:S-layer homology domain-containing protein n=1 Tax=Lysinibacillus sp. SGAir0095 TaxID=2070463 RepID=UPI0010CCD13C|nr:S-layer homology domain-containing protein [Lysinibacillus sp. SGAir0095]QCR32099.1 hypothetical protein C1N55_07900 [Lysinibacillus sp. SGAir0095]